MNLHFAFRDVARHLAVGMIVVSKVDRAFFEKFDNCRTVSTIPAFDDVTGIGVESVKQIFFLKLRNTENQTQGFLPFCLN